jgi:hypothetical protein
MEDSSIVKDRASSQKTIGHLNGRSLGLIHDWILVLSYPCSQFHLVEKDFGCNQSSDFNLIIFIFLLLYNIIILYPCPSF